MNTCPQNTRHSTFRHLKKHVFHVRRREKARFFTVRFFSCGAVRFGAVLSSLTAPCAFAFRKTAPHRTARHRTVGLPKQKIGTEPHRWPRVFKIKQFATVRVRCGAAFTVFYRTAPHRTKIKDRILTAPHPKTLEIEKSHHGSVLHREKPKKGA